jgi:hypothetical protein
MALLVLDTSPWQRTTASNAKTVVIALIVQEMSNTVWALARIGHIPDPAWLDLLWSESFCQLDRFR